MLVYKRFATFLHFVDTEHRSIESRGEGLEMALDGIVVMMYVVDIQNYRIFDVVWGITSMSGINSLNRGPSYPEVSCKIYFSILCNFSAFATGFSINNTESTIKCASYHIACLIR